MHWIETRITFSGVDAELAVDLIADLFYTLGAKGVVVDDPHLEPEEGWSADAVPRPEQPAVTGYLPADARLEAQQAALAQGLAELARVHPLRCTITYTRIDEQDWAESWKAFFWPEKITSAIVVKPTWRDYTAQPHETVIEIDPGMAFGTGTHPTTAMCVQLLETHLRRGGTVLDVGTGSGILLIAAAKLGATAGLGVDADPVAVAVAHENLKLNGIDSARFPVREGTLTQAVDQRFDMVVANILADVVVDLLDDIGRVLAPGGVVICSGIIETRRPDVERKMAEQGLELIDRLQRQEWVALCGRLA
jgi:ribosomal protein L11 methyltransferase